MELIYRRRLVFGMILLMLLFAVLMAAAFINLERGIGLLGIGIPADIENWIIIVLGFLGVSKAVMEIVRIEH